MVRGISDSEIRSQHSTDIQDLKRKLAIKDREIADYRASHGSISTLFDAIKDSIPVYPASKIVYKPTTNGVKASCGVCLLICDSHYGAVQNASEIEGFGEYSPEICEERSMKFVKEVIRWTKLQRNNYKIDRAHVLVAGDLISGDIHLELQVTNAFPAPQQVVGAARILASQIMALQPHFSEVVVHFISADNHARLTKKPQAKEEGINSFNYLVGKMAEIMVCQSKNIKFNMYPQHEITVNVEGRRYLLLHGHGMNSWMGIPYYSLERKAAKEAIKRMNVTDSKRFDKIILGHFHHPISHPIYWVGGSVSGTDAFDHKNGRYAEPSQSSWLVNSKYEFARIDWKL